jgi:hypothetical protein
MTKTSHLWKHPWVLGHRITLHNALKDAALKAGAVLKLSSPVAEVDPESGLVTLKDGTQNTADVIIGADGVHSITRKYVQGGRDKKPISSGKSAFRFLIPRQKVLDDPQTRRYAEDEGNLLMIMHSDRRVVMYPTSNNTLLNFVCIHPEAETAADSSGDWNNQATREMLLRVYRDYHEDFRAILAKADEESLKLWRLLDMVIGDLMVDWINLADLVIGGHGELDCRTFGTSRGCCPPVLATPRARRRGRYRGRCGPWHRSGEGNQARQGRRTVEIVSTNSQGACG